MHVAEHNFLTEIVLTELRPVAVASFSNVLFFVSCAQPISFRVGSSYVENYGQIDFSVRRICSVIANVIFRLNIQ